MTTEQDTRVSSEINQLITELDEAMLGRPGDNWWRDCSTIKQRLLACISTTESGMTFTLYDPETMPRSPTIWGVKEPHRLHAYWRGSDNDDPLIA